MRLWRTSFLAQTPQTVQWGAKGIQIVKGWILRLWRRMFTEYGHNTSSREFLRWLPKAEKKHDKRSFRIAEWWWAGTFTAPCPMNKSAGHLRPTQRADNWNYWKALTQWATQPQKLRGFFSFSLNEQATKEKKQKKVAYLRVRDYSNILWKKAGQTRYPAPET